MNKYISFKTFIFILKTLVLFFTINLTEEKDCTNEYLFKNSLENENEININGSIEIKNDITIKHKNTIKIIGDKNSIINFNNRNKGINLNSIKEIYIKDTSIYGNIITNVVDKIYFKGVKVVGSMKLYNEINTDYIFENCDFISIEKNEISMAFEFYNSHPIFNNCTFYGNKNTSSILNYIGTNFLSNNIEIYNSYFNGNYESICFNGIDSNIIIKNSKFYNCVDNYVYHGY